MPTETVTTTTLGPGCSLVIDTHDDRGTYIGITAHYPICPAPVGAARYAPTDPATGTSTDYRVVWDVS